MKKSLLALAILLPLLEGWAFQVYRSHPLVRPAYFNALLLVIQLVMTWAGAEAARWMLRMSPASKAPGPFSDLTRLWVWCGPFGGLFLALACLLGEHLSQSNDSNLASFLVVAHFSGGALLWCLASAWTVPDLMADEDARLRDKLFAVLGLLTHGLGFAAYALIFPAQRTFLRMPPQVLLIASTLVFCYLMFYIYANMLTWAAIFRVWRPAPRQD